MIVPVMHKLENDHFAKWLWSFLRMADQLSEVQRQNCKTVKLDNEYSKIIINNTVTIVRSNCLAPSPQH